MIKETQIIRWQQPTNCLRVFDHFEGLALKGLRGQILRKSSHFKRSINRDQKIQNISKKHLVSHCPTKKKLQIATL